MTGSFMKYREYGAQERPESDRALGKLRSVGVDWQAKLCI